MKFNWKFWKKNKKEDSDIVTEVETKNKNK